MDEVGAIEWLGAWAFNSFKSWAPIFISALALLVSFLGFFQSRRALLREISISKKNESIQAAKLLDQAFGLLYGEMGYSRTRDLTTLERAKGLVDDAELMAGPNARLMELRGFISESSGEMNKADEYFRAAIKCDPSRSNSYNCLGLVVSGPEKVKCFEKAIECDPLNPHPHYNLGCLARDSGEHQAAENHFTSAIRAQGSFYPAYHEIAKIKRKTGDFDLAKKYYEQVISMDSGRVDALVDFGSMLIDQGNWDDGLFWLDHAIKISPDDDYAYQMMAAVYADKGDKKNAVIYAEKAARLQPRNRISGSVMSDLVSEMKK